MPEMTDAYQWHGWTMVGSDGEKIGKISEIYEDPKTGKPESAPSRISCRSLALRPMVRTFARM
jgi:hypothetical protein